MTNQPGIVVEGFCMSNQRAMPVEGFE